MCLGIDHFIILVLLSGSPSPTFQNVSLMDVALLTIGIEVPGTNKVISRSIRPSIISMLDFHVLKFKAIRVLTISKWLITSVVVIIETRDQFMSISFTQMVRYLRVLIFASICVSSFMLMYL